jgi:hypothetical protein
MGVFFITKHGKKLTIAFSILLNSQIFIAQCSPSLTPYVENFQGLPANNQLPACWTASGLGTDCLTYSAQGEAAFYYSPSGAKEFITGGMQLFTGVTYFASVLYRTSSSGNLNWNNFRIGLSASQSTMGMVQIASVSPANSANNTQLWGTFSVPASGVYYLVLQATGSNSAASQYLYFDDVSVSIPCFLSPNSPTITIVSSSPALCSGTNATPVTFTASGADSYTWANGATTATNISTPNTWIYYVLGSNSITGCSSKDSLVLSNSPSPTLAANVSASVICAGESVTLIGVGASTISWNNQPGATVIATPMASSSFTMVGINVLGCTNSLVLTITVQASPSVNLVVNNPILCKNEVVYLQASGALVYSWMSNTVNSGSNFSMTVSALTTFTVVGQNNNGCKNTATVAVNPSECLGIGNQQDTELILYPTFAIDYINVSFVQYRSSYSIFDIYGNKSKEGILDADGSVIYVSDLNTGMYFFRIENDNKKIVRFVKVDR